MILVDTSVWIDHFRNAEPDLVAMLELNSVLCHPFVIGEIALGTLRHRAAILEALGNLPHAGTAADTVVLDAIETHSLTGSGIGYVDAHLLAAVAAMEGALLWTRDKRLDAVARRLDRAYLSSSGPQ